MNKKRIYRIKNYEKLVENMSRNQIIGEACEVYNLNKKGIKSVAVGSACLGIGAVSLIFTLIINGVDPSLMSISGAACISGFTTGSGSLYSGISDITCSKDKTSVLLTYADNDISNAFKLKK